LSSNRTRQDDVDFILKLIPIMLIVETAIVDVVVVVVVSKELLWKGMAKRKFSIIVFYSRIVYSKESLMMFLLPSSV
jgi:hypothetical protein